MVGQPVVNNLAFPKMLAIYLLYDPFIPHLGISFWQLTEYYHAKTCILIFIETYILIAKLRK